MGPKKAKEYNKNSRRWTETELSTFAEVLADPGNSFAITLDKLALKKSANNEVFECIQKELAEEMESEDFKERNAIHFDVFMPYYASFDKLYLRLCQGK